MLGLGIIVIIGVVRRYVFNNEPPYTEQVALLLMISVAMFGAAAGVRESGHIGLDSVVKLLPKPVQRSIHVLAEIIILSFGVVLFVGGLEMATSTYHDTIPTLGISEIFRYLPVLIAAILIVLFSIEHLLQFAFNRKQST